MNKETCRVGYSVIIPVYNSTQVLGKLRQRIEQVFVNQIEQSYEIIFVDDGSPHPDTWPNLQQEVATSKQVRALRLSQNVGQHAAIVCGLAHAKGAYLIIMDDDLQHAPEDIPSLLAKQKHAVVMGQFQQKKHSIFRNLGSSFKAHFDRWLSGKPPHIRVSTFCLLQRPIAERMLQIAESKRPLLSSLVFAATKDVVGVQVSHSPRQEGNSGYSFYKMIGLFYRVLFNFALSPASGPHYSVEQSIP